MTQESTQVCDLSVEELLRQGEICLTQGDLGRARQFFDQATKLFPADAHAFFRQGLAYFEYGSTKGREKALLIACKKFKAALALTENYVDAWHAWGNALFLLGKTYHEHHYFQDAQDKLRQACEKIEDARPKLHWDFGAVCLEIARHSGEAVDFQTALEAFQRASSLGANLPEEFWNDFGSASLHLAEHIGDVRLLVKAMSCFKHAISINKSCAASWELLAAALRKLYDHSHDEDHFSQASDCFSSATSLSPQNTDLWLAWAHFLLESGRQTDDVKRLRLAIEKCHHAHACNPNLAFAHAIWAEALALIGEISDRVDLLYEAETKIQRALELDEESIETFYSYGNCLCSFGHYFEDFDFYHQAIETFQEGLSRDRTSAKLWHAIAKTYTFVAELEEDLEAWEKSLRFYAKAEDLTPTSSYIFDYAFALSCYGRSTRDPKIVEQAICEFERALSLQKNAAYLHPEWLFHYASSLDFIGDYLEEESWYTRAIEIFSHVLMIDPEFPEIHHRLGLAFFHLGDLTGESEHFFRALHYYRLSLKQDEENEQTLLDLSTTLINIAERTQDICEVEELYREAEHKIIQAAKLGNVHAFYLLSCLYSILGQYEKAMRFILKAEQFEALPSLDELHEDDWLEGLRTTEDFRAFLHQLGRKG